MRLLLETIKLSKKFGGLWALKKVDVGVEDNEILGIIGPNGAGKTTLFNVITGFIKADEGSVFFNGENITGLPPYKICRKGIARTFQLVKTFSKLTLLENVMIGALSTTKDMKECKSKAEECLQMVGLGGKKSLFPTEITTIDCKLLEIAKVLATSAKLLLLDEAMVGLTPTEADVIISTIQRLREQGYTFAVIEHVLRTIRKLCDRIVVLHNGSVITTGTPDEMIKDRRVIEAYLGEEYAVT
jgi:branched-chain amino acid transport system ATP-binding protein